LPARLRHAFEALERLPKIFCDITSGHCEVGKRRARIGTRRGTVLSFEKPNFGPGFRSGMLSIVTLGSTRDIADKVCTQCRYFVPRPPANTRHPAHAVRAPGY
jgi:hypothetical protein